MRLEIEASIDALAAPRPQAYADVPVVGHGAMYAFGRDGRLRIRSSVDGSDRTARVRAVHPGGPLAFDKVISDAQLMFERAVLRGPSDDEVAKLRSLGWNPESTRRIMDRRAEQEQEQAERLAAEPQFRRGRLRDLVAARYMISR